MILNALLGVEGLIANIAKTEHIELGLMGTTGLIYRFAAIFATPAAVVGAVVATHLITIILAGMWLMEIVSEQAPTLQINVWRANNFMEENLFLPIGFAMIAYLQAALNSTTLSRFNARAN
jgi:hypothetical protein